MPGNPQWVKGVSGNPYGRAPKGLSIADYIGSKTQQGRLLVRETLKIALHGESENVRLSALAELWNRYAGKPIQAVITVDATPEQQTLRALVDRLGAWESGQVVEGQPLSALAAPDVAMPAVAPTLAAELDLDAEPPKPPPRPKRKPRSTKFYSGDDVLTADQAIASQQVDTDDAP